MLDTSNIPVEELPQAMYEESMKSWSEAFTHTYSTFSYLCKSVSMLQNDLEDAVSKEEHALANHYLHELMFSYKQLYETSSELSQTLTIKPKKPDIFYSDNSN